MDKRCVDTKNYEGVQTIFTQEQREKKWLKHPELRDDDFIKRIKSTVEAPSFVYKDLAKNGRLVYYKYEYSVNGRARYIKVVLVARKNSRLIVTAYRPDYVKERGKTKLVYGKND